MTFAGINLIAVLAAAVAAFIAGSIWYGVLGKAWMAALGRSREDFKPSPGPFIIALVGELVMAFVLAGVMGHLGEITIRSGLISGAFIWLGFVATTVLVNNAYQGAHWSLPLIDAGHWLVVLLVMGAVIGAFGI